MPLPFFLPAAASLFASSRRRQPRCPGSGSAILRARRAATDEKYTARPADAFPSVLVSREQLRAARAEAGVLDALFARYKREAGCEGQVGPAWKRRLGRCGRCGGWCCNACRFHTSYRIVSTSPLVFADQVALPPDTTDHTLLAPNKRMQDLQIRLRDHEHPYAGALALQFGQRWHGYCHDCLRRVSASLVRQLDGRFEACECERADAVRRYRGRALCAGCFEEECRPFVGGFEDKACQGRGCGVDLREVGWGRFQAVCGWCSRIVDARGIEAAREAWREGEDFRVLRRDSRRE